MEKDHDEYLLAGKKIQHHGEFVGSVILLYTTMECSSYSKKPVKNIGVLKTMEWINWRNKVGSKKVEQIEGLSTWKNIEESQVWNCIIVCV